MLAFCKIGSLFCLSEYPAMSKSSSMSINKLLIFSPREYLINLGILGK